MALIRSLTLGEMRSYQTHPEVDGMYYLHETDGSKMVQINTYGRPDREFPGKLSQSIQLDEQNARVLYDAMKRHFGFE